MHASSFLQWLTHDAAGFFTFLLVAIGLFQLGLFWWQLKLIRESLDDTKVAADAAMQSANVAKIQADIAGGTLKAMEDTAKNQLRAYLGVERAEVVSHTWGTDFAAEITIVNSGQTPANKVTFHINTDLEVRHGDPVLFHEPERRQGETVIVPQTKFVVKRDIAIGGPSGMSTIESNERRIVAWGRVDYLDVFHRPQRLEFRFKSTDAIRKHDQTVMRTVGWQMEPDDEGNTST